MTKRKKYGKSIDPVSTNWNGAKIIALRMQLGWNTRDLAKRSGLLNKRIMLIERRRLMPTVYDVEMLAKAFQVSFVAMCVWLNPGIGER